MPELPEVETVRRAIEPKLQQQIFKKIIIRQKQLRWPVEEKLHKILIKQKIHKINRRGKYLLLQCDHGYLIIHLGMSGRLLLLEENQSIKKHDHADFIFQNNFCLRYHDPRRFGAIIWTEDPPEKHVLLTSLGVEPLTDLWNEEYLFSFSQKKNIPIKLLLMDHKIVVGIGNIYANESLFLAGIHPERISKTLTKKNCVELIDTTKHVLTKAIQLGGTTLKDFYSADNQPGYFQQELFVYGRAQQPCIQCNTLITISKLGQRSTYWCDSCQS